MVRKSPAKPKPDRAAKDREEYERFLDTARKVEASDDPSDFDRAFNEIAKRKPQS